jgi:hypothetical protein
MDDLVGTTRHNDGGAVMAAQKPAAKVEWRDLPCLPPAKAT